MNIIPERGTASRTTTALPSKRNGLEIEWRATRFLVRIITKISETITSRMPVGYEDETGFHYGVAEARLIPIRAGRRANPVLRRGG